MSDAAIRSAVLDPARSFIVQAPAGSGKTELLIQRYLALLATVQGPEQVVAITFTRKAAAEMRGRVQRALRAAAEDAVAERPHERATLALARAVIERDRQLGWSLLDQPQRLRVDTLDAFNVWLAQQLPVLAGGVAAAGIVDDARDHYAQAAHRTLESLVDTGELGAALQTLVRAFGNNLEALEDLLAALLAKRDQWLEEFAAADAQGLREHLEAALRRLVDDELQSLARAWPDSLLRDAVGLLRHAAQFAEEPEVRAALEPWLTAAPLPTAGDTLGAWRAAAAVLLTKDGTWRRRLDKIQGLGPAHSALRERGLELLEELADYETLRTRLAAAATLPDPHYMARQWQRLAALRVVARHLAAELKVLFAELRCVDFVELSLAARRALGESAAPSELLLALDRRIQHFLVDEFQDTSQSQLRLLELLTSGWEPGDGRTMFLVGDPMQSIYRFRNADMSLFLHAKQRGVGPVRLESVTLERNFRSAPQIVGWVNRVFANVFPADDDLGAGRAGFRASAAARETEAEQAHFVRSHALRGSDARDETARVIELLAEERARDPDQSIAVLVQSRTHLAGLYERLQLTGWPVHAVEIETLGEQPLAQALLGLARALVHLGDRIAWLAVLKAPWCGMTWADLHDLVQDAPRSTVWELLHDAERIARLSADGRRRVERARTILANAFALRGATPFAHWVERVWHLLDGPACIAHDTDLRTAQQFFTLLARSERYGDLDDPARLDEVVARAQLQGDPPRERGIEIMTMHKSKGLEFDTVVLLGLGREPRGDDPQALYWLKRVAANGADDLLIAPLAPSREKDRLVAFVRDAERERTLTERGRLLYVATTRARNRLHLVCQWPEEKAEPSAHTLLALLWPTVGAELSATTHTAAAASLEVESFTPVLRRLRLDGEPARALADPEPLPGPADSRPEFAWAGQSAVHVGTVVHRYLQQIADQGLDSWSAAEIRACAAAFRRELALLGVERDELGGAAARVMEALLGTLEDVNGRWVLAKHSGARSELRLTVLDGDRLAHLRLDRTFVVDGIRWIIDFKTSAHEGGDLESFLDSETERYRAQLEAYAHAIATVDPRPVRVGLYFPLLKALRTWPVAPNS